MVQVGQRVRVTLLRAVWGWAGNERTIVDAAGTIYEGVVGSVDEDSHFPLSLDDGTMLRFSIYDSSIAVELVAPSTERRRT
jgi:hypothetical protein